MFISALARGFRLGFGRPGLALLLWTVNVLAAVPAALVLAGALEDSFGGRIVEGSMREGFDATWFGEFASGARGLEATFAPGLSGGGAFLRNLEGWATGGLFRVYPGVVALALGYALVWALLLGGVLSRFAEPERRFGPTLLLQKGGEYFFRFFRLALCAAPLYYGVYRLHGFLDDRLAEATRAVTVERTVLGGTLAVVALTVALLALVHVVFAYAKIATVLEGHHSALAAALHGLRFFVAHPLRSLGLWLVVSAASAIVLAVYVWSAPGATQSSAAGVAGAFLAGQLVLFLRLMLQLSLLGAQLAFFRDAGKG